jgi:hypothetical protein
MINSLVNLHWAENCRLDNRLSQTTVSALQLVYNTVRASEVGLAGLWWEDRAQRQDGEANKEGKIISIAETKSGRKRKVTTSLY